MEQYQSEKNGKTRRQYPSIWSRRLKELRERNNLSQADVAKVLHCSQVAYGMYELGKRKLPPLSGSSRLRSSTMYRWIR